MKRLILLIPLLGLLFYAFKSPRVHDEVTGGIRELVRFIRKALAYVSAFLTKRVHNEVEFTVLEETED